MKQYRILKAGKEVLQNGDEWRSAYKVWSKTTRVGKVAVAGVFYRRAVPFNYKKCPLRDICSVPYKDVNCEAVERCQQVWKRLRKWFKNNSPA